MNRTNTALAKFSTMVFPILLRPWISLSLETSRAPHHRRSGGIVAYVRTIGLQAGDQQILTVQSPDRTALFEYRPPAFDHDEAQSFISAGRKPREVAWPTGIYVASYRVVRDGTEVLSKNSGFRSIQNKASGCLKHRVITSPETQVRPDRQATWSAPPARSGPTSDDRERVVR